MTETKALPVGWSKKRLDEIGDVYSGSTPATNVAEYWDGEIVWITPADLSKLNTPYISSSGRTISAKGLSRSSTHLLPPNSIVISSRAPIGYVAIPQVAFCTNQGCKSFDLYDGYNAEFVYYNLNFHIEKLKNVGEGTTFSEISKTALCAIQLPFPELKDEQEKIASVLSRIDQAIEQTEALLAKHRRIKAGLMHDLLTKGIDEHGNIRSEATHEFKDSPLGKIPKEWTSPTFEEITPPDAPICYGIVKQGKYCDDGIPVIAVNNLQGDFDNLHLCSSDIERMYARSRVRAGDVLVSVKGTTGRVDIVPDSFQGNISRGIARIRPAGQVYSEYLRQLLTSPFIQNYLDSAVVGTTRAELSIGILRKLYLLLPHYDEQVKIASVLKMKAVYLSNLQSGYEKLKRVKRGLMQDLLTGNVPVTPLLETQPHTITA